MLTTYNASLVLSVHLFFTIYMVGLIWFVQVVHYPLMGKVGKGRFVAYEQAHTRLTGWVTAPPMLIELVTGVLLWWQSGNWFGFWGANLAGILLLWASTFLIQVPLHGRLSQRFDEKAHRRLVQTNWIRPVLWTARGIGLIWWSMK